MEQERPFPSMRLGERIFCWSLLPLFSAAAPLLLGLILARTHTTMSPAVANAVIYLPALLLVLAVLHRWLRESFAVAAQAPLRLVYRVVGSYGVLFLLSLLQNLLLHGALGVPEAANPNQDAVNVIAETDFSKTFAVAVLAAPIVEESIFRGSIFGTLREKSRWAAWLVTVLLFAFFHLWDSLLFDYQPSLWIALLDYVPGGLALCLCYEWTGTVWGPILLHMLTNALGLLAQRAA